MQGLMWSCGCYCGHSGQREGKDCPAGGAEADHLAANDEAEATAAETDRVAAATKANRLAAKAKAAAAAATAGSAAAAESGEARAKRVGLSTPAVNIGRKCLGRLSSKCFLRDSAG